MAGINARRRVQTPFIGPTTQFRQTRGRPVPSSGRIMPPHFRLTPMPPLRRFAGLGDPGTIIRNPVVVANADGSADVYTPPPPHSTGISAIPWYGWALAAVAGYMLLK